ncbi:MAG: hypothetical protein FWB85_07270 [Chitinispirillia bacterium]|nr:hypothetical protein [Chitinispirillia bacterium]MCL2242058.1 hypothetical protein [Chitinispirillia bacterium]
MPIPVKTMRKHTFSGALCAAILTVSLFAGCGGSDDDGGNTVITPPPPIVRELDPALLLDDGFAWTGYVSGNYEGLGEYAGIFQELGGREMGFIFEADSTFTFTVSMPIGWVPFFTGRWYTTSGGTLTAYALNMLPALDSAPVTLPDLIVGDYTALGGTLSITLNAETVVFTVTDITEGPDIDDGYGYDPALVNTSWKNADVNATWQFVYDNPGILITAATHSEVSVDEEGWFRVRSKTSSWYTQGGKLYLKFMDEITVLDYSVDGDVLTIDGETFTLVEPDNG